MRCSATARTNYLSKWEGSFAAKVGIQTHHKSQNLCTVLTEQLTQKCMYNPCQENASINFRAGKGHRIVWGGSCLQLELFGCNFPGMEETLFFFPSFLSHENEDTIPTMLLQHKDPGPKLSWFHGCYSQKHLSWRRVRIHRWCILTTLAPLYQYAVETMEISALQRKSSWGISLSDTVVLQSLAHPCFQRASLEGILKWQPTAWSTPDLLFQ